MRDNRSKRLVVGVSGASGMPYALRFLQSIPEEYEIHLIVSSAAKKIFKSETGKDLEKESLPSLFPKTQAANITLFSNDDHFAPVASGSFHTDGMVIIPCSMKTLSGVANGYAQSLIERAADVTLKEKRKLVLVVRETPLNTIHLKNMLQAAEAGAVILPASPGFYAKPQSLEDIIDFIAARTLEALHIPQTLFHGWKEV